VAPPESGGKLKVRNLKVKREGGSKLKTQNAIGGLLGAIISDAWRVSAIARAPPACRGGGGVRLVNWLIG